MSICRYFTASEATKFTGATYRQLDYWVREGVAGCSGRAGRGKGTKRYFTFGDMVEIKVIRSLLERGVSLRVIRHCVFALREQYGQSQDEIVNVLSQLRLETDGKSVFKYVHEQDAFLSIGEYEQFAFRFEVGQEVRQLRHAVQQMARPERYSRRA